MASLDAVHRIAFNTRKGDSWATGGGATWLTGTRHHFHEHRSRTRIASDGHYTKHYTQLKQIADDVDDTRVYGGIHFRFDQVDGNVLGRAVATKIYKNCLRPVHGPE